MSSLTLDPLIPASLWVALAVAGAVLLAWYCLRRPGAMSRGRWAIVLGLMSAGLALVLLILLNPMWVREIPPPAGKPLLTVLVDASGSMATPDGAGGKEGVTRYQAAVSAASSLADQLHDAFDVRIRTFTDTSSPAEISDLAARVPGGQSTDLATAVADCLAEGRPQGQAVALLSDGGHNAGPVEAVLDASHRAKAMDAPIYTRTFGGPGGGIDLTAVLRTSQDLAFAGQRVPVTVLVGGRGVKGAKPAVTLLYDGKEVGRQVADLTATGHAEVRFWVQQEKAGAYAYEARVEPIPGEATQSNNSATYLLRVVDQPIRVILLEGKPYWDSKFLVRTLSATPAVELDSIVRVADGRLMRRSFRWQDRAGSATRPGTTAPSDASAPEPVRSESWKIVGNADVLSNKEALKAYQIVVLGRDAEAFLTDQAVANLGDWVAHEGGSLVCSRGSPTAQVNQRLARLLPVRWSPAHETRFRMKLTDQGRDMHWLADAGAQEDRELAGLPTLASTAQVDRSKPLAVVLATSVASGGGAAGEAPAVVYQPYGSGRVVVIDGAGMWRWAFLPPQYQQRDEVYNSLWQSLLRWLTSGVALLPGQNVMLRADKVDFSTQEPATATLLVREESTRGRAPAVELLGPNDKPAQTATPAPLGDEPGNYRVNFGKLLAGRYQARVAGSGPHDTASRAVFDVRVYDPEQLDIAARPDLMARIATDSGGAVLGEDPAGDLITTFSTHLARSRPPRYDRATAWDKPWVLVAIFGLWAISWAVRRAGGLV